MANEKLNKKLKKVIKERSANGENIKFAENIDQMDIGAEEIRTILSSVKDGVINEKTLNKIHQVIDKLASSEMEKSKNFMMENKALAKTIISSSMAMKGTIDKAIEEDDYKSLTEKNFYTNDSICFYES